MRPHIFLMLTDDHGSYDASYRVRELGRTPDIATPAIDGLAADGLTFSNYYVQPICTPTRASLLSGRYSIHTGSEHILFGMSEPSCLPVDLPLMPAAFRTLNYSTHMVGKWHLGYVNESCSPWRRGFDTYLGYLNGNEGYFSHGVAGYADWHECSIDDDASGDGGGGGGDDASDDASGDASGGDGGSCAPCSSRYAGRYSTEVYAEHVQSLVRGWSAGAPPLFVYLAWQSVHEPLEAPERYVAPFASIADGSRRVYAGMLAALDEAVGNISASIRASPTMYANSILVFSSDNGGMSGTYDMECCRCGTSCGGLNYPYRGWKDSFWEGGFRGLGFIHSPLLAAAGAMHLRHVRPRSPATLARMLARPPEPVRSAYSVYAPLLWVGDWYATLLTAATANDTPPAAAAARAALAPLLAAGPIDSISHWRAMGGAGVAMGEAEVAEVIGADHEAPPRSELLMAGIDADKRGAAIRVGAHKLLVGAWGDGRWCDLNVSGASPAYPAPAAAGGLGGEGGLVCVDLKAASNASAPAEVEGVVESPPWWETVTGLFNVEQDPRELHDLQHELPELVASLRARLLSWRNSTAPSIHRPEDPAGKARAAGGKCWRPWE